MAEKRCLPVATGALVAGILMALSCRAEVPSATALATPPQPQWTELTVEQRVILAPLSDEWDAMDYGRQKKWLGITRRFATMTAEEQRRVQVQMQEWGKLTPEQRRLARENFISTSKLPTEKKQELRQKWEEYSNLPEEEKERLKQQAESRPVPRPGRAPSPATTAAGVIAPAPVAVPSPAPSATPAATNGVAAPATETMSPAAPVLPMVATPTGEAEHRH